MRLPGTDKADTSHILQNASECDNNGSPALAKDRVYVIELDKSVLPVPKFRQKNPDYNPRKPRVYVGQTVLTPKERFQKHLAGEKANRFVRDYGVRLKPRLDGRYNPMSTRAEAVEKEEPLAKRLRKKGYGVWQA